MGIASDDYFDHRSKPRPRRSWQKPTRLEAMMGIDPNRLNRSQYHSQLGCGIKRFEYDFATCVARLFLPDGHCTDMDGAIKLALALDDRCVRVETFTGTAPDTRYILRSDGEWYALPAEGGIQ